MKLAHVAITAMACIPFVFATGCGIFSTPKVSSPCDGLYCISVETTGVPGAELLCYQTAAQRDAKKLELEKDSAKKVTLK